MNPELERAIAAEPDQVQLFLVYGDWLQERNDPRGELIALQYALSSDRDPRRLLTHRQAERELLARHASRFYGEELLAELDRLEISWRLGFFDAVTLDLDALGAPLEVLEALLAAPSARFLRTLLVVGGDQRLFGAVLARIIQARAALGCLRSLRLGSCASREKLRRARVSLEPLCRAYPRLQRLVLDARGVGFGGLRLAELRWLELRTLCGGPEDLGPLLSGRSTPGLRSLVLDQAAGGDALCGALVRAPVLGRLEVLGLRDSPVTDRGVQALLEGAVRLRHLRRLDLTGSRVSTRALLALRASLATTEVVLPVVRPAAARATPAGW